jgi:hypothetical protein
MLLNNRIILTEILNQFSIALHCIVDDEVFMMNGVNIFKQRRRDKQLRHALADNTKQKCAYKHVTRMPASANR